MIVYRAYAAAALLVTATTLRDHLDPTAIVLPDGSIDTATIDRLYTESEHQWSSGEQALWALLFAVTTGDAFAVGDLHRLDPANMTVASAAIGLCWGAPIDGFAA